MFAKNETLNDVNSTSNYTSQKINVLFAKGFNLAVSITVVQALTNGSCFLEVSHDGVTWYKENDTVVAVTASDSVVYNVADIFYTFVRVRFTSDAGLVNVSGALMSVHE